MSDFPTVSLSLDYEALDAIVRLPGSGLTAMQLETVKLLDADVKTYADVLKVHAARIILLKDLARIDNLSGLTSIRIDADFTATTIALVDIGEWIRTNDPLGPATINDLITYVGFADQFSGMIDLFSDLLSGKGR